MWDASAKGTAGILAGASWDLGSFDECLSIEGPVVQQYCLVQIQVNLEDVSNSSTVEFIKVKKRPKGFFISAVLIIL